ncbi:tryptophan 7-halogenase [Kitasatospora purpeofusca]|uniref:NAD(P)/FAD-dependent oxidoreductase n=1 Tax=Kitasatospora purpeofusca TaxID=67352 RepID=A0ABZ1UBX6_9ACTN|nr:tryptophan 7-halogenase [Kitasatospora purpeofusca]
MVVVGGGPAGATAARTLALLGLDVALLERSAGDDRPRPGETLPPAVRPVLARLGLADAVAALDPTPSYGNVSAWGGPELRTSSFVFQPYGHGWHLDRSRFDELLRVEAAAAGATVRRGVRLTGCRRTADGSWRVTLAPGEELRADGLIDASGCSAALARSLGAWRDSHDRLVGVAVRYPGSADRRAGGYTLVEAGPDGWWYSASLPTGELIVVQLTDADLCRAGRLADPRVFARRLAATEATRARVSRPTPLDRPRVTPVSGHRLRRPDYVDRWVAAGDAALGVDPLSSSGILRALLTGEAAAHALTHWLLGRPQAAVAYDHWLDTQHRDYLTARQQVYAQERRWPHRPFWQRRWACQRPRVSHL